MHRTRAVALDVDGVLTDSTFYWGPSGEEFKRFSFLDIMGVSLGRGAGLIFALISGEDSPLVDRYAEKMGITDVFKGCKDKAAALRAFVERHGLDLSQVCFIGDDVNDLPAMRIAGISGAPATAHGAARDAATYVARCPGGLGAVREIIDLILAARESAAAEPVER
jgi:3-deoxy-D-manno-octulosonate 8-phosphate phosphatase (KDO 8-P phosphatase)